jgi:hypothetical protein
MLKNTVTLEMEVQFQFLGNGKDIPFIPTICVDYSVYINKHGDGSLSTLSNIGSLKLKLFIFFRK